MLANPYLPWLLCCHAALFDGAPKPISAWARTKTPILPSLLKLRLQNIQLCGCKVRPAVGQTSPLLPHLMQLQLQAVLVGRPHQLKGSAAAGPKRQGARPGAPAYTQQNSQVGMLTSRSTFLCRQWQWSHGEGWLIVACVVCLHSWGLLASSSAWQGWHLSTYVCTLGCPNTVLASAAIRASPGGRMPHTMGWSQSLWCQFTPRNFFCGYVMWECFGSPQVQDPEAASPPYSSTRHSSGFPTIGAPRL